MSFIGSAWASQLGLDEVAELLETTLAEEKETGATELAEGEPNLQAVG